MARKPPPQTPAFALEGDLDIFSVHTQWERLRSVLSQSTGDLTLDLSSLGDLDVSGFQLLAVLHHELHASNRKLTLGRLREEDRQRILLLGLPQLLEAQP